MKIDVVMATTQPPSWLTFFFSFMSFHYLIKGQLDTVTTAHWLPSLLPSHFDGACPFSTSSNFYGSLPSQLASHQVVDPPDEVHNFLLHFCSLGKGGTIENQ
jgi:hypothetical protein